MGHRCRANCGHHCRMCQTRSFETLESTRCWRCSLRRVRSHQSQFPLTQMARSRIGSRRESASRGIHL